MSFPLTARVDVVGYEMSDRCIPMARELYTDEASLYTVFTFILCVV